MRLSLCMIVKNEAANLPRCLTSVQGIVDEMIVLDTGSTDDTVAIAQDLGASVHSFSWNQNFAAARNASLQYATGDWVLVLDADETLTPGIGPALRQAMQSASTILVNLVRQEVGAVQSPYSLVSRLFRRHPEVRFSRPYHAMVDDSITALLNPEPHWQIATLPQVAILHAGYQPNAIAQRGKLAIAQAAMAAFLADHPDDAYTCSKLGALYQQMGQAEQGIGLLQQGLQSPNLDPGLAYELHYHLGIAYRQQQKLQQAAHHYQAAIAQPILPTLKLGAYNNWGNLLKDLGHVQQARQIYEQVIQIDPELALGHYNLGLTLRAAGNLMGAIAAYQRALTLQPDYAAAHQNLGVAFFKLGKIPESLAAFQQAIALYQTTNPEAAIQLQQELQKLGFQV